VTAPPRRLPVSTRFFYGVGAVAYGVKDNGFGAFLLLYYNQVLGLRPSLAGTALMLALVLDAVSDPLVGWLSDHWHSRWKRRHPFMYAAALPLAACYALLWNPPAGLGSTGLFLYLLIGAVAVRTVITLYEVPSSSLVAELTADYDERTRLLAWRYFFGWYGGLSMAALAYTVFLAATPEHPNGVLNPAGYRVLGIVGASAMFVSALASSLGTHRYIPSLQAPPDRQRFEPGRIFRELRQTLGNRSFLVIFWGSLFAFVGIGVSSSLNLYMNTYFWELPPEEIRFITYAQFFSALLAFALTPRLTRVWDKKRAAVAVFLAAILVGGAPVVLRLLGLFPSNESPWLLPILVGHGVVEVTLLVAVGICISSMLADVAEENELRTGRREEGLFFAARSFAQKATSGLGVLLAGIGLDLIDLPASAQPGAVEAGVVVKLGLVAGPAVGVLYLVALVFLSRYGISRTGHAHNLALLSEREPDRNRLG
jgi:GPH family glycoside/pentoside/hexuronide:cation symporter